MPLIPILGKNDMEIIKKGVDAERAISLLETLVANCPNPTQAELRKLLAVQGTILNQIGFDLLLETKTKTRVEKTMRLAFKALDSSRAALEAAAKIGQKEARIAATKFKRVKP